MRAAAQVDDAHVGQAEHQLAVAQQRLELGLLRLQARDVGQHRDHLVLAGRRLGAPHRQRVPRRHASPAAPPGTSNSVSKLLPGLQRRAAAPAASGRTARRCVAPAAAPASQAEHGLEAPVAAHQHRAAQVGDAGGGAVEDGGQLAQQLLALALRAFLLGDVERDHGAPARAPARPARPASAASAGRARGGCTA